MLAILSTLAVFVALVPATSATAAREAKQPVASPRAVVTGSWTTYHNDDGRTGYDPSAPAFTGAAPTAGWTMTVLDDDIYGEPLIFNGVVYVATLSDTVYALSQVDGHVVWSKHLGTPQTGGWGCGNINPTGILGTGVIDTSANRIYEVAEIVVGTSTTYHLFGLDLGNSGNVVLNTTLTTSGFTWTIEQERGALALHGGYVYVPFGGRAGDCGNYHGYVFAVNTSTGAIAGHYTTPGQGMGIWSAGGVVVDDSTGNVFVSTGNGTGSGCNANSNGTAVYENDATVRLAPGTLAHQDAFYPQDWKANWCDNDQDVGSIAPLLISPNLLFQTGKWGAGFLLDPNNLGGMDGQRYPTPKPASYVGANTCLGNQSDATFGSAAYAAPYIYLECDGHGLVALSVNTGTPSFSPCNTCASPDWHAGGTATFGPPIVAGGAVWVVDTNGGGLYAFNPSTGAQMYHSATFGTHRFVTPAEAGGQVFVPAGTQVRSFTFAGQLSFSPSPVNFGGQAPATTSTAQTVTFTNGTASTVNVTSVAVTGGNSADYSIGTDTCSGQPVAGSGGMCTVQVSFRPPAFGGFPAALTFTDSGPGSPQAVQLNGLGALDDSGHLYTLDGFGGVDADGSSPAMSIVSYWPGWNIARSLALFPDGTGGYVLDGYGGLHPVGSASGVAVTGYWPGWDIAREVVLAPWATVATPAGWVLDGYGGLHPFGGAPSITGNSYFGWDIARGVVILPDSTPGSVAGYTLDGYGGVHPFGGAQAVFNGPYWGGWDIARSLTLSPDASKSNAAGWVVDGYGGIHPFGSAPGMSGTWYGSTAIAKGIVAWTGSGPAVGGWVLDGYGGIHRFGSAPAISTFPYWAGWNIANSLAGNGTNSGSRHK
ncbi:MAG TPA: PQQ-binding-like beta-propeller repeat protein [Candidatus Dormibacteraeota bacterium]|nr:PQQ-binding-like beta-propeller repeat protein [Candidatus Dormibacteraeota bacterium]